MNARTVQTFLKRVSTKSLNARKVQTYLHFSAKNSLTESAIRPLTWMLSRHYEDRTPEVEAVAAPGGDR